MRNVVQDADVVMNPFMVMPRMPFMHRKLEESTQLIFDNVSFSMVTPMAKSMFTFLVCGGAPGIGSYFLSCYIAPIYYIIILIEFNLVRKNTLWRRAFRPPTDRMDTATYVDAIRTTAF